MIDLIKKYNKNIPRYTSYPTAPVWSDEVSVQSYLAAIDKIDEKDSFAVYVHLPFCRSLCNYCACHVFIRQDNEKINPYLENLKRDITNRLKRIQHRLKVRQIHFGGGSPSYLSSEQFKEIFQFLKKRIDIQENAEIAIELDPRTTTIEKLETYHSLGINRVSFGVQDFDERVQKEINRIQDFGKIKSLFDHSRKLGFHSINFDLIYGLPYQSLESFEETLNKVKEISPDRVALFSYAHVPWIKKHQNKMNLDALPAELPKFQLLEKAREFFTDNNYLAIGMDHFAKMDDALSLAYKESRLNRNFMGYTDQDVENILGFGVSSIGKIKNYFFQNHKTLKDFEKFNNNAVPAIEKGIILSDDDLVRQRVIMNIMCKQKLVFSEIEQEFNINFLEYFKEDLKKTTELEADDLITVDNKKILITEKGKYFLRNVASIFDIYLTKTKVTFSKAV